MDDRAGFGAVRAARGRRLPAHARAAIICAAGLLAAISASADPRAPEPPRRARQSLECSLGLCDDKAEEGLSLPALRTKKRRRPSSETPEPLPPAPEPLAVPGSDWARPALLAAPLALTLAGGGLWLWRRRKAATTPPELDDDDSPHEAAAREAEARLRREREQDARRKRAEEDARKRQEKERPKKERAEQQRREKAREDEWSTVGEEEAAAKRDSGWRTVGDEEAAQASARPEQDRDPRDAARSKTAGGDDWAAAVLGLKGDFTREAFTAAYRKAVKANHPDRGGSAAAMADINQAARAIKSRKGWR